MALLRTLYKIKNKNLSFSCLRSLLARNYTTTDGADVAVDPVPSHARVVVCGGGVIGTSIAYHLAERGWTDVVLLDQGQLTCGTTWHSAGMVGQGKDDVPSSKLIEYSRSLYKKFEAEGNYVGWKNCGSLMLAQTEDRFIHMQRKHSVAIATGVESHVITPDEVKQHCPWIRIDDLAGALWIPGDGVVNPTDLAMVYTKLAKQKGVKVMEGIQVQKILTKNGAVNSVETSGGTINCEHFVNCGGLWSREIGKKSVPKVKVPLHANEHFYIITKEIEGLDRMMPVIRDYDGRIYIREWGGGVLAGGFEPVGKPIFTTGVPEKFEFQLLPEDWDHFQILLDPILHRMPVMETAEIRTLLNGPESFTPDANWILGESAEISKYYIAAGMCSMGVVGSGGIGKVMSEWIIDGIPSLNMSIHDVQRFVVHHNNKKFLHDRVKETIGLYTIKYPYDNWKTGRNLRTSPLHSTLEEEGAVFGETNAYERPVWFTSSSTDHDDEDVKTQGSFRKPAWFESVKEEYWACKERVCIIDMSSFSKLEIKSHGDEALNFLQYMCSNNIDQDIFSIIHTGMQNEMGGYENDCTIVPMQKNHFFMISPTSQQTRSFAWLRKHLPQDGSVTLRDITSAYSGINVIGPHAYQLLSDLTDRSMTLNDFKPMTCDVIDVGYASGIRAMRLTHAGEDGFVLYIPSEYTLHVYDMLMKAGKDYGISNAGYYALRMLRIEKFFAFWGQDLTTETTPLECGREFRVKFNKGDFIGREALLKEKEEGISQRFVQFFLHDFDVDADVWPWGGEPVYRNGKFAGIVSSSGYGFTLDKMICLGFVRDYGENDERIIHKNMHEFILDKNAKYEIAIAGRMFPAEVRLFTPKQAYTSSQPVFIPVPSKEHQRTST